MTIGTVLLVLSLLFAVLAFVACLVSAKQVGARDSRLAVGQGQAESRPEKDPSLHSGSIHE